MRSFYHHRRSAFGVSVSVFSLVLLGGTGQRNDYTRQLEAAISKIDPLPALETTRLAAP